MASWQKRARWGIGTFGILSAVVVYFAIDERQSAAPPAQLSRLDPRSILESTGAAFQQFRADKQEYVIKAERQLTYEGGATKFFGVTISVGQRAGRDFVISGREAQSGEDKKDLEISGDVRLSASDGFVATTERATFRDEDATVRAVGPVSFQKGRMSGSGTGMSYDQRTDVLTLASDVHVGVTDETGATTTEFMSGAARLARLENYLALDGNVHVLRGEQVLQADAGRALLSENDDIVTFIELRGHARVMGGETFDALTARDIDMDYTNDGIVLERVVLSGAGAIAMRGGEDEAGRRFAGNSLDLGLAPDGTVTRATGRGDVRVDLPGAGSSAARTIVAQRFDATGEPGAGLTGARFEERVEYRESGRASRVARSGALRATLAGDAMTAAVFSMGVAFEAEGLRASSGELEYDPSGGALRLRGAEGNRDPRVADADIEIDADAIDVVLDGPRMKAVGEVRALLHPRAGAGRGGVGGAVPPEGGRLPGLLQQSQAARVTAGALDYQGTAGIATFSTDAMLSQGETTIRADTLALDQRRGDLSAVGNARANLPLDDGVSIGRAQEIRYEDGARRIVFGSARAAAPGTAAPPSSAGRPGGAQLSGPQGDLRASRIEVLLAKSTSTIDRLEGHQDVTVRLDTRAATGERLTYYAQDGRYVMTGIATVPVTIIEECRDTTGRTVTFFRAAGRIIVDGNEQVRTQSTRGASCPESLAR